MARVKTVKVGWVGNTIPGIAPIGSAPTASALPMTGNTLGDVRTTDDTGHAHRWSGSAWIDIGQWRGDPGDLSQSVADTYYVSRPSVDGTRTQSLRHGPTRPYWAPSSFALPQDWDGRGDGLSDDTTPLQSLITAMSGEDTALGMIPAGDWVFTAPLAGAANATIAGQGPRSRLVMPATAWAGYSSRAAIEVIGVDNFALRDVVLDGEGASRPSANSIGQFMLVSNARNGLLENVVFRGGGVDSGLPSGPYLAMLAADDPADHPNYASVQTGPVEGWTLRRCVFEAPAGGGYRFAIRMLTNFLLKRPMASYAHYALANLIDQCWFTANAAGEGFTWNSIELAGQGTLFNEIMRCHFWGHTLSHVDFDKGASFNTAHHNVVHSAGKSQNEVGSSATRHFTFNDHGMAADYMNLGNTFHHNLIQDVVNLNDTDVLAAAIGVQHARDHTSEHNDIRNVQNATIGGAVYLDENTPGAAIVHNRGRVLKHGIRTANVATDRSDMVVDDNDMDATDLPLALVGPETAGQTGKSASRNTLRTTSTTVQALNLGEAFAGATVAENDAEGGETGLYLDATGIRATGNKARNAQRGARVRKSGTYIGNDAIGTLSNVVYSAGIVTTEHSNSWNPKTGYGTAAPTAGTWARGDRVYNTAPAASGQPIGWVCLSGGTPGTWAAFGTIA